MKDADLKLTNFSGYKTHTISFDEKPIPYQAWRKGKWGNSYNPKELQMKDHKIDIQSQYSDTPILDSIRVSYSFYFACPLRWSKKRKEAALRGEIPYVTKPDADNLMKFYNDCLKGIVFFDDNQVSKGSFSKDYAEDSRVEITIYERRKEQ